jgi:hypothetical protein
MSSKYENASIGKALLAGSPRSQEMSAMYLTKAQTYSATSAMVEYMN